MFYDVGNCVERLWEQVGSISNRYRENQAENKNQAVMNARANKKL